MLSVPTLWIVFVVNFLALGLVWSYVARSYPNFQAARFWCAAAFVAAGGAAISMLRGSVEQNAPHLILIPLLIGGTMLIAACCFAAMGIERFYNRPVSWRINALVVGLCLAGFTYFIAWDDSVASRIFIYSLGQSVPIALTLPLVLSQPGGGKPGARLAGYIAVLIIAVNVARAVGCTFDIGGESSMMHFNSFQAALVLVLVFLSMAWNFGFLLMAIDRLRGEVADLALFDDLTGVANRRQLLTRLTEECARSDRAMQPFALLAIDLDGFKEINDNHGHGAGDECLRLFSQTVQERLRSADLLARMGGDEFCVVLPSSTMREAASVARQLIEVCSMHPVTWTGTTLHIGISIGIAQWSRADCNTPEQLMAAADQALYTAKKQGKARFVMAGDASMPASTATAPEVQPVAAPLLKSA